APIESVDHRPRREARFPRLETGELSTWATTLRVAVVEVETARPHVALGTRPEIGPSRRSGGGSASIHLCWAIEVVRVGGASTELLQVEAPAHFTVIVGPWIVFGCPPPVVKVVERAPDPTGPRRTKNPWTLRRALPPLVAADANVT